MPPFLPVDDTRVNPSMKMRGSFSSAYTSCPLRLLEGRHKPTSGLQQQRPRTNQTAPPSSPRKTTTHVFIQPQSSNTKPQHPMPTPAPASLALSPSLHGAPSPFPCRYRCRCHRYRPNQRHHRCPSTHFRSFPPRSPSSSATRAQRTGTGTSCFPCLPACPPRRRIPLPLLRRHLSGEASPFRCW